jgi:hypothetical protein
MARNKRRTSRAAEEAPRQPEPQAETQVEPRRTVDWHDHLAGATEAEGSWPMNGDDQDEYDPQVRSCCCCCCCCC